jgi:hypothetical protein
MTIDHFEYSFYGALARIELLSRQGSAFQDFFVLVGGYRWSPDFEGRRAQGAIGDKKCDGYRASDETVFQCYAPRQMQPRPLCAKIKEDFFGALRHRSTTPIKKWILVHNDQDQLPTEAHELIIRLRRKVKTVAIEIMGPDILLATIMEIRKDRLMLLFPHGLSSRDLRSINYKDIDQLIDTLGDLELPIGSPSPTPPSNQKIAHNRFSADVTSILKTGFLVQRKFADYFSGTSRSEVGDRLAEKFKRLYASRAVAGGDADEIFFALTEAVGGLATDKRRRAAIVGLIAYMFHSCEIFEDAPQGATP